MSNRPVTKREQYLAKAAGITSGSTPPAVTRTEHFLKAIADGTGYQSLPTAVTKEEQYLKAMTGAPIGNAFFVWHSSVKGGGTNGMPERVTITDEILENGYDLTSHIPYGTLYGGYALRDGITTMTDDPYDGGNWMWETMQTANGQALQPVAGETYYVKELPWGYLMSKVGQSSSGGKVVQYVFFCAVDHVPGTAGGTVDVTCGYYLNGVKRTCLGIDEDVTFGGVKYTPSVCSSALVTDGWVWYDMVRYSQGDFTDNSVIMFVPYITTKDGVEVKGTEHNIISVGDRTSGSSGAKWYRLNINPPYTPPEEEEEET